MSLNKSFTVENTNNNNDDKKIVENIQSGQIGEFANLYLRYKSKVAAQVFRSGVPKDDVEDVVQLVFTKAFRAIPDFRGDSKFSTWLHTIANNCSMTFMTSAYNRYEYCVDDFEEYEEHFHSEYDYEKNIRPLIGRLNMGIERLPPDLREVFCLRFFSNMKYDTIGRIVGCPPGTVRSRLSRARNQIRNHLESLENLS